MLGVGTEDELGRRAPCLPELVKEHGSGVKSRDSSLVSGFLVLTPSMGALWIS